MVLCNSSDRSKLLWFFYYYASGEEKKQLNKSHEVDTERLTVMVDETATSYYDKGRIVRENR